MLWAKMVSAWPVYVRLVTVVLWFCAISVCPQPPVTPINRKFEYKHSFKGPNLAQKDGTLPFWEISGDAIASSEQLRLAPSIRSKQGMAWNLKPMTESEFWDVEISFKVTGQGRIGADGLAFWYTATKGMSGSVFGSNDYWTGLGLFFDSFDNDAQRNNPYIMVMINDGTRSYDHNTDGLNQKLGGCMKDFRNKPYPVKAKIEYSRNIITVLIHDGMTQQDRYELCVRAENVFLPRSGYFGLSAATGGLADDHDVLAFLVASHNPVQVQPQPVSIPEAERRRIEDEFKRQQEQFQKERDQFAKEHPDKVRKDDMDYAKLYEDAATRELRLIYEGQNIIHTTVAQLDAKISQLLQQQQQQTALISQVAQGAQPAAAGGHQPAAAAGTGFQRHEVNEVLQLMRETHSFVRDFKSYITDIHAKASNIDTRLQQGIGHAQQVGGAADQFQFQAVKTYLEGIKHDVEQVRANANRQPQCPVVDSHCLSTSLFFVGVLVQTVLLVMYWLLKGGHEKAKFY